MPASFGLWSALLVLGLAMAGCQGGADVLGPAIRPGGTGLRGLVVRGPVQPVCTEGEPCADAPFAATFDVYDGARRVTRFRSGEDGRFEVALAPGRYAVVPGPDAPLLAPESQRRDVTVGAAGATEVALAFDTGIR